MKVKGACLPGLPPPLGEEGATLAISTSAQKTWGEFYSTDFSGIFYIKK